MSTNPLIRFACTDCGRRFKVDNHLSGRTAKCPCGKIIYIPETVKDDPVDRELDFDEKRVMTSKLPEDSISNIASVSAEAEPKSDLLNLNESELDELWRLNRPRIFHEFTNLAGVSHNNPDGSSRQEIIAGLKPGDYLKIHHDENNSYDKNALRVLTEDGRQIGFIPAYLAEILVEDWTKRVPQKVRVGAHVLRITGGTDDRPTMGVNIVLIQADHDVSNEEGQAYLNSLDLSDEFGIDRADD